MAGTSVSIIVGGAASKALTVYTSAKQLATPLPSSTPAGTGIMTVTYNGSASGTAPIRGLDFGYTRSLLWEGTAMQYR